MCKLYHYGKKGHKKSQEEGEGKSPSVLISPHMADWGEKLALGKAA